jgi:hypothetical protein
VIFYPGGTALSSSVALTNGVATLVASTLPAGTDSLTAVYSGDTNFQVGTSNAVAQVIEDFNLTISTSAGGVTSVTAAPGSAATYLLVVAPQAPATRFPAVINLKATGLPAGATYALTPSSLAAGSGSTNVTLVVNIPATPPNGTSASTAGNSVRPFVPLTLAPLLLPFARRMRRAAKRLARLGVMLLALAA